MAKDWVMVRVSEATHVALCEVRESLLRGHETGKRCLDMDDRGRVSLDQVIGLLIAERQNHAARRRRAASKRRST